MTRPRVLADSNLVIYGSKATDVVARPFLAAHVVYVSDVSVIEALGYHKLTPADEAAIRRILSGVGRLSITAEIVDRAVDLRQVRNISLPDAVVAATSLVHGLPLATRNTKDFGWINQLVVLNPYANL